MNILTELQNAVVHGSFACGKNLGSSMVKLDPNGMIRDARKWK